MLSMDDFPHVVDQRVRSVLAHWLDLRAGRMLPARREIDPGSIRTALAHVWLCDYERASDSFRYRLSGEEVNAIHGKSLVGRDLAEALPPDAIAEALDRYRQMMREPFVIHMIGKIHLTDGRALDGERVVVPLGADGAVPDALMGVVVCAWRSSGSGVLQKESLVRTVTPLDRPPGRPGYDRVARHLRITGRVQGVWFRQWTVQEAARRGLDGWVRNRSDGSVEAVIAGQRRVVAEMIRLCGGGPPAAHVESVSEADAEDPGPIGFEKRATL